VRQFIGIEDLAGNALIELLQANATKRRVTFKKLIKYGTNVSQFLNETGEEQVILLYRESDIVAMKENYADFFEVGNFGQEDAYIELKEGIETIDLWMCFRSPFSIKTMLAFMNKKVIQQSELLTV